MRAGLLTEKVLVLHPTITTNKVGEQITEYEYGNMTAIRARDVSFRQQRQLDSGEVWMQGQRVIEVRMYHDICDNDLIEWRDKRFRILAIETDRQQMCKRITLEEVNQ